MPNSNPSQNGKNPGWGCPTDQPDPTDLACTTIAIANAMNPSAVRISARRMSVPRGSLPLADGTEQAALDHQVSVEGVGLLEPLDERRARHKLTLQRVVVDILLPVGRLRDTPEQIDVVLFGILRDRRRRKDPSQHQIGNI